MVRDPGAAGAVIYVGDELLPPWEEKLIREELVGGWRIPPLAKSDGCSRCPDSWPPWRPMEERILLRDGCLPHDFAPRYEAGSWRSWWHRAAQRWEDDGDLHFNWRRLPHLEPYRSRFAAWSRWERAAYWTACRIGFRMLRFLGWTAKAAAVALLFGTLAVAALFSGVA